MQLSPAQQFIYITKYARWMDTLGRREISWKNETSKRYIDFFKKRLDGKVPKKIWGMIENYVGEMGAVGSMRAAWGAGPALEKNHIVGYNCSYVPFQDLDAVVELFYILMCGTGVGFSVETRYTSQMPTVKTWMGRGRGVYTVADSREGWADSLKIGLSAWFNGEDIEFDYSKIRPRGARLVTMGGRASGPAPLKRLHDFCRDIVMGAQGRKLNELEWLDVGNVIGDVVVVGGVRRASEINFSDLSSELLRNAKTGSFPVHRRNSNNAAVYYNKPSVFDFMKEWSALASSFTGERSIFNVEAVKKYMPDRREFRDDIRTNPCGEILLRPFQFCNLSEVVVRSNDKFDALVEKVKVAVWLGAMQATLTDFPYIRPDFKKNCEEEVLLGVSLTGQMDNPKLMTAEKLEILKEYAVKEAKKACNALGINMSVSVTTGKPSGTVSQLVDCASGCHPRYAAFYNRRYRLAATDPAFKLMRDQGVFFEPEVGERPKDIKKHRAELMERGRTEEEAEMLVPEWNEEQVNTWVCSFPSKSPKGSITRNDMTAIEQLEWYLKIKKHWAEHNQSVTIFVRDEEWMDVGAWVYKHFNDIVAVSFLPYDGGNYELAPYEEITEEEHDKALKKFPKIDWSQLSKYETDDMTEGAQTLACTGGSCEIV